MIELINTPEEAKERLMDGDLVLTKHNTILQCNLLQYGDPSSHILLEFFRFGDEITYAYDDKSIYPLKRIFLCDGEDIITYDEYSNFANLSERIKIAENLARKYVKGHQHECLSTAEIVSRAIDVLEKMKEERS